MKSPCFADGIRDVLKDWDQLAAWIFEKVEVLLDQSQRCLFALEVTFGQEALDHDATGFLGGITKDQRILALAGDDDMTCCLEGFLGGFPPLFVICFCDDAGLQQSFELIE